MRRRHYRHPRASFACFPREFQRRSDLRLELAQFPPFAVGFVYQYQPAAARFQELAHGVTAPSARVEVEMVIGNLQTVARVAEQLYE